MRLGAEICLHGSLVAKGGEILRGRTWCLTLGTHSWCMEAPPSRSGGLCLAFCHQTLSWPAAPVYQNLRMLAARPQFSGLRVYLSFRKIIMDRDPWRFKDQVPDWKIESERTVNSQPAHIADTILGSLIKCRSVLHTSRGGSSCKAIPISSRCPHLLQGFGPAQDNVL